MITAILFFIVLALCFIFLPATKIYVLGIAAIAIFCFAFEPVNRWTSALLTSDAEIHYKPLYENPGPSDYEVLYLAKNTYVKDILFDTLNGNTFVYTNNEKIYKISLAGDVIGEEIALSWEPISYHKLPILVSMDSELGSVYLDWINTSDTNLKEFKEFNADRSMSLSQWNNLFNEFYQKASAVEYANLYKGHGVIFKINSEWILLKSFINENGDSDGRFHWNGTDITFDDFPIKEDSQLIRLNSSITKGAYKFNYQGGTPFLKLEKYKKLEFEWPSCPPGLPLPIVGGFIWSGVGYYDLVHHNQHIKFSLPTQYSYRSLSYDGQLFPYYLPAAYAEKSDIMFLDVAESYSQGSGEDAIHRDGLGFYIIRKKRLEVPPCVACIK